MNNEINTMIELQHYWDIVLLNQSETERYKKSIQVWEKRLIDLKSTINKKEELLKNIKLKYKQSELNLENIDAKIVKIELRKDNIKSERELEAQNNELKILKEEKNSLESTVLELLDKSENSESELTELTKELEETIIQTDADIRSLKIKIENCQNEIDLNKNKFEEWNRYRYGY